MSMELKSYLSRKFEGRESFLENIVFPIFGEERFEDMYDVDALDNEDLQAMAQRTGIKSAILYGLVQIGTTEIYIYDVTVSDRVIMRRNRVGIQQLIRKIMETYTSAFIIFHYEDSESWDWRFSFCQKDDKEVTEAKRYTFLLGPDQSCRTAAENFQKLINKHGDINRDDIVQAFDVAALSDEFFGKYKAQYEKFCNYIYDNCEDESLFGYEFAEWDEKLIRDYVKKLLGRIVFLHFLQKKGWLGVPLDGEWGDGDKQFMKHLFEASSQKQKDNYLDCVLEPLFAEALNTLRTDDIFDLKVKGFRNIRIPYLNGGLFERDMLDEPKSTFPASYFDDLFEFFYQYNFTIDENDPNDAEVGIDPEMLGRIFENLLEDNKDKGAFYTPKEIVQYMCRESLIAYLQTDVKKDSACNTIRQFVSSYDASLLPEELKEVLDKKLKDVKICDPAIGSGAFPMGLLRELYNCRKAIEGIDDEKAVNIKTHIIQNNIYGVDIEKGAVDIARLRFWLALIVDEQAPHALPNLDFKIMQGNSLLEQFEGVDLSGMSLNEQEQKRTRKGKAWQAYFAFDEQDALANIQHAIKEYYNSDNHAQKVVLRNVINENVRNYILTLKGCTPDIRQKIKELPIPNDKFFLWHIYFKEVFDKGGFDIVIGNPPYINVQLMSEEDKTLYKKLFSSLFKRCDIFALFIENGLSLSSSDGILTYIIPSVIHSNLSYQKIRDMILNKHWLAEVCYTGGKVFNAPTVDTTIIRCNKHGNDKIILKDAVNFSCHKIYEVDKDYFSQFQNVISIGERNTIYDKLFNKDFITIGSAFTVFQGIVTGNNPAFIFENEDDALAHGVDTVLLHPLCHGRDIGRYEIKSRERRILYIDNSIDIEDYPNTKKWLLDFKEQLSKRREAKKGVISWYGLQWPRVKSELDIKEKILIQRTRNEALKQRIIATIDEEGVYGMEGIYFIITKDEGVSLYFLLGILNSKLMNYLFATKFLNLAIKAEYLKQVMIPSASDKNIITLVKEILQTKRMNSGTDTSSLEHEIDQLVYQLYGLTDEEIAIVEGSNE
ncbi:MAG: TaqI-like C-terminal specificity domain-containing protein [Bacteroidales bacterium]|nr:TaqI-like C-terminal specificity domain-containing protein [Bacteroidales bacterium]